MQRVKAIEKVQERVFWLIGVFAFSFLTALGARIKIPLPFTPVPITLQVFFVLFSGAILGKEGGALSQLLYLALGSMGLPFFASGSGALYLSGPTGGYLAGFVVASYLSGCLIKVDTHPLFIFFSLFISLLVIYLFGILHLSSVFHIGLKRSIEIGMLPFLGIDIIKILLLLPLINFYYHGRGR
ncbi:biotin transporter BioY [Candidatus Calescamantes bacterium]|nr:biotin transporter BioY [Candidatus Calescamantes bacterium]